MLNDPTGHHPLFRQIADYLRGNIAAGIYRPDEALPSKRTLALKLGVNPLTVQHAYSELEREGLVESRKGIGMFVSSRGVGRARNKSEQACYQRLLQAIQTARRADLSEQQIRELVEQALVASEKASKTEKL